MEWQPIETAPKDGTPILVFLDGDVYQGDYCGHNQEDYWSFPMAGYHGCGCCGDLDDNPTHWMPLPAPPNT